jgi:hypothetical protein
MYNQILSIVLLIILAFLTPSVSAEIQSMCSNGYLPSKATIENMSATQIVECWGNMVWDLIYIVGGIVAISAVADFRHAYIMGITGTPRRDPVKLVAQQINPPATA